MPALLDVLFSYFLVDLFGGCEVSRVIRILFALPCIFVDVFRFIDSPYKRRAARRISRAILCRNIIEAVLLIGILILDDHFKHDLSELYTQKPISVMIGIASIPFYWMSVWCIAMGFKDSSKDIFTACEAGDIRSVVSLTTEARIGIDLNIFDIDGNTPLMLAVNRAKPSSDGFSEAEILRLLIEEGARVDLPMFEDRRLFWQILSKPMRRRWTPLHLGASRGCLPVAGTAA
jgi:hypothetical protein